MSQSARYRTAQVHVRDLKDFWVHLAAFVVANAGMMTVNLVQQPDKLWFHWVLLGWGAGLLLHGFKMFGGGIAKNWEEKKIQEIVKRDEAHDAARSKSSTT